MNLHKNIIGTLATLALLTAVSASAQGIKWHPGHYVMLSGGSTQSQHLAQIAEIGSEPAIKGVQIRIWWHKLERSKDVYDFSSVDAYLKSVKSQPSPKRLVVRVMDRKFQTSDPKGIVPDYLRSDPIYKGGVVASKNGYVARLWEKPVMDRLIALYKALGSRYDADVYFEGIASEETTLGFKTFPAGYSHTALNEQYKRLVNAARPAMPRTNIFLYTNFIGSADLMSDLIQSLVAPKVAAGGSNVAPQNPSLGQRVWTGQYGADYRGLLALSSSVETAELGGKLGDYTPKQINDFAYSTLQVNYLFWTRNSTSDNPAQQWRTGILPFLRTNPPIRTSCPSSYGICVK